MQRVRVGEYFKTRNVIAGQGCRGRSHGHSGDGPCCMVFRNSKGFWTSSVRNRSANRVLDGVLELSCLHGEVQQERETAQGAVEQMQQVLDQVRPGNCDDPAHHPSLMIRE